MIHPNASANARPALDREAEHPPARGDGIPFRTSLLTGTAMVAFAANSILTRAALDAGAIDPASFTSVRLGSGALVLMLLARRGSPSPGAGSWGSALALFAYAALFSFAYLRLGAGLGALLLFGAVQVTMIAGGVLRGERPRALEWAGLALALGGLAWLALPGSSGGEPLDVALMLLAGVAWGVYSLRGRSATHPLAATAQNFARGTAFALALQVAWLGQAHGSARGFLLAVLSGTLASGLGYAIWYSALPGLRASQAAVVQLSVPVIAAGAAVLMLGESLGLRWLSCALAILGGIALAMRGRTR